MNEKHVLDGVRVLDFTQHLAGPTTTRLMAEMGAEIVKLELAPWGDQVRQVGYLKGGRSAYFLSQNRGKKSLCVDVKTDAGEKILRGLIPQFDVLVENFAPGVIGRMGLDWKTVHKLNPNLIMCSISTFGQTGPLADRPGFDYIGQAYAGVTGLIGEKDGPPILPMVAMGDVMTGVHGLAAINAALFRQAKGGPGQHLDISLLDSYFHCHESSVAMISGSEGRFEPPRGGSHSPGLAPLGAFKGRDGYLIIIAVLHQWDALCDVMGMPELLTDPRFEKINNRVKNRYELVEIIEGWIMSCDSDDDAIQKLEAKRIPVAPVLTLKEAMEHPHLIERGTVRTVTERGFGTFQMPGMPLRFSEYANDLELEAPYLGEHNRQVLKDLLSYSDHQIDELEQQGALKAEAIPEEFASAPSL
ncbi:MAG: CoA transferase [Gammaproteobacteria bacterium]|nr:MAG: CoA transferase [Gammaproteobacteria bacterium]